jgi:hypothetical protein
VDLWNVYLIKFKLFIVHGGGSSGVDYDDDDFGEDGVIVILHI